MLSVLPVAVDVAVDMVVGTAVDEAIDVVVGVAADVFVSQSTIRVFIKWGFAG